jgi:hypothetical protein
MVKARAKSRLAGIVRVKKEVIMQVSNILLNLAAYDYILIRLE